jgi:hypothetical protein
VRATDDKSVSAPSEEHKTRAYAERFDDVRTARVDHADRVGCGPSAGLTTPPFLSNFSQRLWFPFAARDAKLKAIVAINADMKSLERSSAATEALPWGALSDPSEKEPALLRRDPSGSEMPRRCFGRERPWAR